MKIPNKQEIQQIAFIHSSDTGFKDFTNIYYKCILKPCCFVVVDRTPASDNPLVFRKNLLERILK